MNWTSSSLTAVPVDNLTPSPKSRGLQELLDCGQVLKKRERPGAVDPVVQMRGVPIGGLASKTATACVLGPEEEQRLSPKATCERNGFCNLQGSWRQTC